MVALPRKALGEAFERGGRGRGVSDRYLVNLASLVFDVEGMGGVRTNLWREARFPYQLGRVGVPLKMLGSHFYDI